ncbi:hypothetical protein NYE70_08425 [Paenibacillus sp. FSL R5-0407]|uniref:hypothetical protein n=1 Tax=Paenibacillus sp. FSL R5-0407 TaxID=2975320 RepID=UPI0030FBCAF9
MLDLISLKTERTLNDHAHVYYFIKSYYIEDQGFAYVPYNNLAIYLYPLDFETIIDSLCKSNLIRRSSNAGEHPNSYFILT